MAKQEADALPGLILELGLATEAQLQEASEGVGPDPEPAALLRALERKGILTNWQSQKLLRADADGYLIGGYRVLYQVASGSFGRVFRAVDPHSGGGVAVKVLRKRWSKDPQRVELFLREGKVGESLHHPNIVRTLMASCDQATGQYYLVMDFVEGDNLRAFLDIRKKLVPAEALRLIENAAQGLAYAHAHNVSHRDIKLTNILISSDGKALLVDFGLAQIYALGKEGDARGERTIDYAALERATGARPGDPRSDIFFLGCILYEMLTGRSPLMTGRDRTTRQQIQRFDKLAPISPAEVEGPPSVLHLVETMMAFSPQHRHQTAAQLLDSIQAVRREVEGKGPGPGNRAERSVFLLEKDTRLQNTIREKLREQGYKVFLAADPARALDRFRLRPFDALVVDAGTTGEDGLRVFSHIVTEAQRRKLDCAGILILQPDQADWAARVPSGPSVAVLVRPLTMGQLRRKLQDLVPLPRQKVDEDRG